MSGEPRIRSIEVGRAGDVAPDLEDFLRALAGPALVRVPGRDRSRTRAVSTLLHGNEPSGLRAVHAWLCEGRTPAVDTLFFVGSVGAALAPPGFAHRSLPGRADLNRSFRSPFEGPEGAVAAELLTRLRERPPDALVDLHNTSGRNPAYGVGSIAGPRELALVGLFARRFVHSSLCLGAVVEATRDAFPSVTVECGRAGDLEADAVARHGLARFLAADPLPDRPEPGSVELLSDPLRVCVRVGIRLAFGDGPSPGADLTVRADIERYNFECLDADAPFGWLRDGSVWPLEVGDSEGCDRSAELFEADGGTLRTRRSLIPMMMTVDPGAALSDCLGWLALA